MCLIFEDDGDVDDVDGADDEACDCGDDLSSSPPLIIVTVAIDMRSRVVRDVDAPGAVLRARRAETTFLLRPETGADDGIEADEAMAEIVGGCSH